MTDLGGRFADEEGERKTALSHDPLARLQAPASADARDDFWHRLISALRGRADLLALLCAVLAAGLLSWPLLDRPVLHLPEVAETGDEVAALTVHPMMQDGVATLPDWAGLFDAYHFETTLRDVSIRCNFGLPIDARVDRYLHAPLSEGTTIHVFLVNPGKCPQL